LWDELTIAVKAEGSDAKAAKSLLQKIAMASLRWCNVLKPIKDAIRKSRMRLSA
jgi:hypothetical protein